MGAGYHGGFGATIGFKSAYKIGFLSNGYKEYTRNEIVDYLKGVTTISTKITIEIEKGNIGINVISAELFNRYFTDGYKCAGMQVGNQIYILKEVLQIFIVQLFMKEIMRYNILITFLKRIYYQNQEKKEHFLQNTIFKKQRK